MYQFANNATATLASNIALGDTSITVTAGQGARFPVPSGADYYMGTLVDAANNIEIIKVTARAGDTLTVERGKEGTVARGYSAGDRLELRLTKGILDGLVQKVGDQTITGRMTISGGVAGNADTASAWETGRTLTLGGALSGNVTFDGSGNFTLICAFAGGGIGTGSLADKAVTNAKLADMANGTLKGRVTAGSGTPEDLAISDINKLLGLTGTIIIGTSTVTPVGSLLANGALISRTTYANLWAYAQASGNMAASDAVWSTNKGQYSPGDGSTTFRIPDVRGVFLRVLDNGAGIDASRGIGIYQTDDNKSHFHTFDAVPKVGSGYGYSGSAGVNGQVTQTNASGGGEARPKNFAYPAFIRY